MATRLLEEASLGEQSAFSHYIRALPPVAAPPANLPTLSGPVIPLLEAFVAGLVDEPSLKLGQLIEDGLSCAAEVRRQMDVSRERAVWGCSMALSRKFKSEWGSEMCVTARLLFPFPLILPYKPPSVSACAGGRLLTC
jgi:hypothetical protein